MADMHDEQTAMSRRRFLGLAAGAMAGVAAAPAAAGSERPARFAREWGKRGSGEGEFDIPIGIAIGRDDAVFVSEFRNNRVQKFDRDGRLLAIYAVGEQPGGIAVDRAGRIYVAHLLPSTISVFSPAGVLLRQWGRPGTADGELQQPGGIAIAPDGTVYVADQVNRRVQRFTPEGCFLLKWGEYGVGPGQFGGNVGPSNRTGGPQFVAVDRRGCVYTTEGTVGRVQKFTPDGKYLLSWGDNGTEPGGFGGRPILPGPIGICFDRRGRIWVSATNHLVQQFTPEGRHLQTLGGKGTEPGRFVTPHGIAVDSRNCLYVCDTQNARIQKFAL